MARTGDWFCTYSGLKYWLTDPHPDDVRIKDIAHALSMICRFGGHTMEYYSVAQHCVHCTDVIAQREPANILLQLHTLLHDSSEAFLGDVVRPLKLSLAGYSELEARTMDVIYEALQLPLPNVLDHAAIKLVDNELLMTERKEFIQHRGHDWGIDVKPLDIELGSLSPTAAEYQFITKYDELRKRLEVASTPVIDERPAGLLL